MAQKVSQATIDKIKAMGMAKALKGASGASPEMKEALTRMYGARRVSAASGSSKPAAKSADAARAAASKPAKPVAKTADAARLGAQNMPYKSGTKSKTTNMPKKGTTDPFAKFVFGLGKKVTGGANNGMNATQVAAENKRRAAAVAKAKKNK